MFHPTNKNKKPIGVTDGFSLVEKSDEKSNQFPPFVGLSDTKNDKANDSSKLDNGEPHGGTATESAKHIEPKQEKKRIRDMSNLEVFALLENDLLLIMAFFAFLCRIGHVTAKLNDRENND